MMVIAGESPPTGKKFSEQHVDQAGFAALIGMGFHHARSPEDLEEVFWAAIDDAFRYGRPQLLSTGDDIVGRESSTRSIELGPARTPGPGAEPSPEAVAAVVDLLATSTAPLVIAGQGAVLADARADLIELADLIGARVATTLRGNRFFTGHPHDLGLAGAWSYPASRSYITESDVVLAFGASLNRNTTAEGTMFPVAKVVQCEADPDKPIKASAPELALLGDAKATARAIIDEWRRRGLDPRSVPTPTPPLPELRRSMLKHDLGHDAGRGLDVREVCLAFDEKLPADRIVITDSGRTKGITSALVGAQDARSWLIGRGYGSVGLGLGTALGAAAGTGRTAALFCGDGGFMMALAGLDTARLTDLNVVVVILNDELLGAEMKHLRRHHLPLDVAHQDLPDIPTLAAVFGGRGTVLRTREELMTFQLHGSGLEIIDARIDPFLESEAAFD